MWSLRPQWGSEFDKFLVQSFIGETRVLSIEDEELAEVGITLPGGRRVSAWSDLSV